MFALLTCLATCTVSATQPEAHARTGPTVPGRTSLVTFFVGSSIAVEDLNGDCGVTDVDIALAFNRQLLAELGDPVDPSQVTNWAELALRVRQKVKAAFGITIAPQNSEITYADFDVVVERVASGQPGGDITLDGVADINDIVNAQSHIGERTGVESEYDRPVAELMAWIGEIRSRGEAEFMAKGCQPAGHMPGISQNWPMDPPDWWPANHMKGMSVSYSAPPHGHSGDLSRRNPPPPHVGAISANWPANHLREVSAGWPILQHGTIASATQPYPHWPQLSSGWPAAHTEGNSATWPAAHEAEVTRTWWSNHRANDSIYKTIPPVHEQSITETWTHNASVSQQIYPPNHFDPVSDTWGNMHSRGISSGLPPGHISDASLSWPGFFPWPANHWRAASSSWGEPQPIGWPLFPPNHSWFTTFTELVNPVVPRPPWPSNRVDPGLEDTEGGS